MGSRTFLRKVFVLLIKINLRLINDWIIWSDCGRSIITKFSTDLWMSLTPIRAHQCILVKKNNIICQNWIKKWIKIIWLEVTGSAGCKERTDTFNPKDFSAFRSSDYGYTRMQVFNSSHLYLEQVSDDQVSTK